MDKAKEISALWSQIKPQVGELVRLCHEVESHAEVTADAYQRGYENGFVAGHLKAEKSGQSFYEDGYKRGLADAWEAAKWLLKANAGVNFKVFGMHFTSEIVQEISASECIEKIRQYEQQEKEKQIQVGDEVATKSGINGICTNVSNLEIGEISLVFNDGSCGVHKLRNIEGKTGRHFPEIAEVLKKMKENNDNK